MKQLKSNCNEEDLIQELADEGPVSKNKITYDFVNLSNPLVVNKGHSRVVTHQPYESNDFENESPSNNEKKLLNLNKSYEVPTKFGISIPAESNMSVNKFVDPDFIDSIIAENKEEATANKGVELFQKIQKESSEHIMKMIKQINSDKRLYQFRKSIVNKFEHA